MFLHGNNLKLEGTKKKKISEIVSSYPVKKKEILRNKNIKNSCLTFYFSLWLNKVFTLESSMCDAHACSLYMVVVIF